MKTGLIFAGQGAQYPGMGKDLYDRSSAARAIFDRAGDQIKQWCFSGTKEDLRRTDVTQPCVYTVTMAAYAALTEGAEAAGISFEPAGLAGFSLGEYAALTAAGSLEDFGRGVEIVTLRGKWMNEAGLDEEGTPRGGMTAAFGAREDILAMVEAVRQGDILEAVNYNSPVQLVVAGEKAALERFRAAAKADRRVRAVPLSVGTAFHSSMMEPAAEKLEALLREMGMNPPAAKIYSNVDGQPVPKDTDLPALMARQARSPVRWQETVENMIRDGITCFIELGPGKTLSGIVEKIDEKVKTAHVEDGESLEKTLALLSAAGTAQEEEKGGSGC